MRRLSFFLFLCSLFVFTASVSAQETTPLPEPSPEFSQEEIIALATQVAETADGAKHAVDLGFNLLGLFEAISFLVTVVAGVGAVFGVTRLMSAQNELTRARERIEADLSESAERFEKQMNERQAELAKLRDELKRNANQQRDILANALLAQSLLPLGERQYRAQDFIGALDTYNLALKLDPNNLMIHYRLGYVNTQSGNLEEAKKHLARALEIETHFAPALAALGYVVRRLGEKLEEGIERDKMFNRAENYMLEALEISPKLVDEDDESWWGALGGLYRRRGQIDDAIRAYQRATEVTPHSSYGLGNLALLYMKTHNRERMLKTYKRVEKLAYAEAIASVDNYWGYADLVISRLALGKIEEAKEALDTALEIAPIDSPYTIESLLETMGNLCEVLEPEDEPPIREIMRHVRDVTEKRRAQAAEARSGD